MYEHIRTPYTNILKTIKNMKKSCKTYKQSYTHIDNHKHTWEQHTHAYENKHNIIWKTYENHTTRSYVNHKSNTKHINNLRTTFFKTVVNQTKNMRKSKDHISIIHTHTKPFQNHITIYKTSNNNIQNHNTLKKIIHTHTKS